jgi:Beta-propeller repeat
VKKYDASGSLVWSSFWANPALVGSSNCANTYLSGLAVDVQGNVFVVGNTNGVFSGGPNGNTSSDGWVAKIGSDGTLKWLRQIHSSEYDEAVAVCSDSKGNVYVTGSTYGSFPGSAAGDGSLAGWLAKVDSTGVVKWITQIQTDKRDIALAVATDAGGNIFVAGMTEGVFPGGPARNTSEDAWVAKLDSAGVVNWLTQIHTDGDDRAYAISAGTEGDVFVAGSTTGLFPGGPAGNTEGDGWAAKLDATGTLKWVTQIQSDRYDEVTTIATDALGGLFIAGATLGIFPGGQVGSAKYDGWIARLDSIGTVKWITQVGTRNNDSVTSLAVDTQGVVFAGGLTEGDFTNPTGVTAPPKATAFTFALK